MKKVILLSVLLLSAAASFAQVRVGGFLGYGTEIEQVGIGGNAEFFASERLSIAPSVFFYFPRKEAGVRYSYWELNGNVNYYLLSGDFAGLYGLAGLNLTTGRVKADNTFLADTFEDSQSELGLNLGLGFNFTIGNVKPFVEAKYVIGDLDQAVLMAGLKFTIVE